MTFDRPIVAEGLLRQAMIFDDGYKVIRDQRDETVEIYNLATDPGEAHNLSDDVDLSTEEHLLALDRFFEVHTYRADGYTPPLRK
jgi:arylsulfatase A-like enzyme